jgi:hypothetical protein
MAGHCFSKSELYIIRNEIDVRMLIENTLRIPCRVAQGCFRFMCPLCGGFDSAVNPKTNLARCFACEQNFNSIDLVMLTRQTDFVHSAKFLQSILQKDVFSPKSDDHQMISGNPQVGCRANHRSLSKRSDNGLCHISKIFGEALPPDDDLKEKPIMALKNTTEDRIVKLEMQLMQLRRQVQELSQTITAVLPSK